MAYTAIDDPESYFQTVLYTGNATARDITLPGTNDMQPDIVWIKERSAAEGHKLFDSVRGATNLIHHRHSQFHRYLYPMKSHRN